MAGLYSVFGNAWEIKLDANHHFQAVSHALFVNQQVLCDKPVRFMDHFRYFDAVMPRDAWGYF